LIFNNEVNAMIQLDGGQAVVKMLEAFGVEVSFGMAGFQHLPYYYAIKQSKKVRHVLVRDERGGAYMADAYARASGKVAVCDATVGPGVTNLVSGIGEAYYASIPLLAITSDVNTNYTGKGANQECDQLSILAPICKASIYINKIERIPELMRKAFHAAVDGRPGPVHIDVPEDIFHGIASFNEEDFVMDIRNTFPANRYTPADADIAIAAELLLDAGKAVIVSGGGTLNSQAWPEVQELTELLGIPIATTISGKGSITEYHPLSINLFGRYFRFANQFIKEADVILVVGCRLGEMATIRWSLINPGTKIIHLDIDPRIIGLNYKTEAPLVGDAKATLQKLIFALRKQSGRINNDCTLADKIKAAKVKWRQSVADKVDNTETPINIAHMLYQLRKVLPEDSIMVADGGFSAHWSSVYWDIASAGRHYIANRGLAAIGYGLPAAIGAKMAAPGKIVVALSGDGGLGLSVMELETAVREEVPVLLIVVNNKALGYIKALQHVLYGDYISTDLQDINYAEIARICGCYGKRVTKPEELEKEFRDALRRNVPTVVEVMVTTDPAKMLPGEDNRVRKAGAGK
jgi:acetolactate synthase I/II/III large subunit